ncbi:MAG: AraC family transcriptional regulator [Pseudomonadota bacterium]
MNVHFASIRIGRHPCQSAMAEHHHDAPSLCILIAGAYEESIRGRHDEHIPGSLTFCPPHEPHSQRIGRSGATKLILTPAGTGLDFLAAHARLDDALAIRSEAVPAIGRRIIAELSLDDEFSAIALDGLGHELLAIFGRSVARTYDLPARWLRDACDYMAAHVGGPLSPGAIAAAVGCDPVRLSRGFRRAFGHTIGHHQRKLRVAAACELLCQTGMPVAEVAQACGFHDQSHLTRIFKAETGCTPASFRRSA